MTIYLTAVVDVQSSGHVTSLQVPVLSNTHTHTHLQPAHPDSSYLPWLIMGSMVKLWPGFITPIALFSANTHTHTHTHT